MLIDPLDYGRSPRYRGEDQRHEFEDAVGRPVPVLAEGQPIPELI
jgi:hypothetical protein